MMISPSYRLLFLMLLMAVFTLTACTKDGPRRFIQRITLRPYDKIPYGTAAARELLPSVFPGATVYVDDKRPGSWDSILYSSYNQAVFLVGSDFEANEEDLRRLLYFAQQGNYVFIIARSFSDETARFFKFSYNSYAYADYLDPNRDSLRVKLEDPIFDSTQFFVYPGRKYESSFQALDTGHTIVLGRNEDGLPNFIQLNSGNGKIFIHTAPLAFSNYFILHKHNASYFERAVSVIPPGVDRVLWNEYYLSRRFKDENSKEPNMFRVLMQYPAFLWGLSLLVLLLFIYLLLGSRRRQRKIPPYSRPANDSLDFVKTMGRLYHDRRDHFNLSRKMSMYFLEHVRSTYKMQTSELDENFVRLLHQKSGYGLEELNGIVSFINYLDAALDISDEELSRFHKQLELFYQNS